MVITEQNGVLHLKSSLVKTPALQEGIPCSCRAVAVAFPVSMTMKVQVVTVLEVI